MVWKISTHGNITRCLETQQYVAYHKHDVRVLKGRLHLNGKVVENQSQRFDKGFDLVIHTVIKSETTQFRNWIPQLESV